MRVSTTIGLAMWLRSLIVFVGLSNFGPALLLAEELFPLEAVKIGMMGTGRTVFQGHKIEEFQVEILGVLRNVGPKQSMILARLKGGPLDKTGVIAGMSGSPVYLDGKLAGAVAFTFPFSKEPIAGIRPIVEMITQDEKTLSQPTPDKATLSIFRNGRTGESFEFLGAHLPASPAPVFSGESKLIPIVTPVNLAGFSGRTLDVFGSRLQEFGLKPVQGIAGGRLGELHPDEERLRPGSMISVALIRGDFEMSAAGTVTYISGQRLYAFGHSFLSSGSVKLPFSAAEVVTLVPNLNNSFKISESGSLLGTIVNDHSGGLTGIVGQMPSLTPVRLRLKWNRGTEDYYFELVQDRLLTPYLLQMTLFSSIDVIHRRVGASTLRIRGEARFGAGLPSLLLDNVFAGTTNTALSAATSTSSVLYHVLLNKNVTLEGIDLNIESDDHEQWAEIDRVWTNKVGVRIGEVVELFVALKGADGKEHIKSLRYRVPEGTLPGVLYLTFADAEVVNLMERKFFFGFRRTKEPAQLIKALNRLRQNDRLYVRMWRPEAAFRVNTEVLPSLPASVATVLSSATSGGSLSRDWRSVLVELELNPGLGVIRGNVTTQVNVKP